MRGSILSLSLAATLVGAPLAAGAQPAARPPVSDIQVHIGPELQRKAHDYGQRDLALLTEELRRDLQRELGRAGRLGPNGVRLDLQISDAIPNHPTQEQLAARPGLDYLRSVAKGGATIDGFEIQPGGARRKLHFENYEQSLRMARGQSTWGDAENTFDWFARDYARGKR